MFHRCRYPESPPVSSRKETRSYRKKGIIDPAIAVVRFQPHSVRPGAAPDVLPRLRRKPAEACFSVRYFSHRAWRRTYTRREILREEGRWPCRWEEKVLSSRSRARAQ